MHMAFGADGYAVSRVVLAPEAALFDVMISEVVIGPAERVLALPAVALEDGPDENLIISMAGRLLLALALWLSLSS